jgi:transcriptional regulator with XRE-family HTH domain
MSGDYTAFAAWLRHRAKLAGYDLDERGMTSRLAEASGIDSGQMSRAVRGLAIPAIEGQRGLAKALGLKLPEVMIQAGIAEPDDFPSPGQPQADIPEGAVASLLAICDSFGVDEPEKRTAWMVNAISMGVLYGRVRDDAHEGLLRRAYAQLDREHRDAE